MSITKIEQRIESMETKIKPKQRVFLYQEHPDGTVTGDVSLAGEDDLAICIKFVKAIEGRQATDDELEALYPGRRARIALREREAHL
jgi:hypothetical protein